MSGWTLGKVTFPMAPRKILKKMPSSIKKIPIVTEAPWMLSMGPDTIQLALEGEFFTTNPLATVYTNFCKPIENYVGQTQIIDEIIMNDSFGSGTWHEANCTVFKNTGNDFVKDDESIRVRFNTGAGLIWQEFSSQRDYSNHNFVSLWARGDTAKTFKITFYNEAYASKTNGYRAYKLFATTWTQLFIAISGEDYSSKISNTVGTPTGWDKIKTIVIEPSEAVTSTDDYWFDQMVVGQGWKLDSPGTRYDGIYAIADFSVEEGEGNVRSFRYKINLMDKTQMYGTV